MVMGSQDNGGFVRRTNGSWGNTNGGDAMWQLIDPNNSNVGYTEYWEVPRFIELPMDLIH